MQVAKYHDVRATKRENVVGTSSVFTNTVAIFFVRFRLNPIDLRSPGHYALFVWRQSWFLSGCFWRKSHLANQPSTSGWVRQLELDSNWLSADSGDVNRELIVRRIRPLRFIWSRRYLSCRGGGWGGGGDRVGSGWWGGWGGGGFGRPPIGHHKKSHDKLLHVAARHHNIVVCLTQQ